MDKDSRALRLRTNLYRMYQGQLTFLIGSVAASLVLQATDACLEEWGCFELRERSRRAARANVISCAVYLAAALVLHFVSSLWVMALAPLVSLAFSIWAIVLYMGYLKGSSRVF